MSGHSKWHNIQARKGKQDAKRSASYSKFSKLISIAARNGGDPEANFSLRLAIDRAKQVGVPKDNIERAIKNGTGELAGAQIEEILYECYGPGGVAILVKTVTDNKNRTVSDLKHFFNEYGGSLAGSGSVLWMFQQAGFVEVKSQKSKVKNSDEFELSLMDVGADDFEYDGDDLIIRTKVENLQKVLNKLKEMSIEVGESGLEWIAKDKVKVEPEIENRLNNLFGALEESDDVEDYFTNAE
jgi:YebC/PmpR family DNA-binding regulatory protein